MSVKLRYMPLTIAQSEQLVCKRSCQQCFVWSRYACPKQTQAQLRRQAWRARCAAVLRSDRDITVDVAVVGGGVSPFYGLLTCAEYCVADVHR